MIRKKKKLILWVLAAFLVGGAGLVGVGELLIQHRAAVRKRDGIAASIAGDHEKAADLLGRYLQRNPSDADEVLPYYIKSRELAELPNGQHLGMTMAALKMLIGDQPDRLDDRRHLLELYARLERRPEAVDLANAILSNKNHPEWAGDLRTLEIKTDVLAKLNQDHEALDSAEMWAKLAPLDIKAQMARMELHAVLKHPQKQMIADAEALRLAHPGDPRFELLEGFAYGIGSDEPDSYTQAVNWTKTAAAHPQLSDDVAQLILTQFDQLGLPEDSLAVLQAATKRGAGPELRHALGKRLWEQGRWEPAAAAFADVDPQDPSSDATLVALKAITLANLGKSAEAEAARTALSARKLAAAKAWVLLLRRIIDAAQLDDKQVITACRAALQLDPRNPYLAYYLGDADARLGELDQAVQAWRVAEAYDGTWNVPGVRLVEALLQGNHPDQAQWIATDAIRHNHTAGAAIALARAYSLGNTANAEQIAQVGKLVDQIQRVLPNDERTLLVRIEWLCRQDKKAEARDTALTAVNRQPVPGEQFLVAVADKSRQYGLGIQSECLAASRKAHGVTPGLAYAQAVDRFLAGQKDQAVSGFDADARVAGKPQDLSWRQARAELLDFTASPDAKVAWIKLGDEFPNDITVQHAFLTARSMQGDWDAMGKAINRLKTLAGENAVEWRMAQARLEVLSPRNDSDYEQGALDLNDLLKLDPTSTAAHELLARALVHMKRIDGAIEQLTIAAKQDTSSVPIALELAALLQSRGDFDRVQKELDRVTPWIHSPSERKQAAAILAQQGNSEGALEMLEHPTTRPGEDGAQATPDLLTAELYRRRREFDKAEQVVGKLLEHPDLATIRFAASLYVEAGRMDQAQAVLAKLDDLKLDPGMKELALGGFSIETGQLGEAIRHYQAATIQAPTNPVGWRVLASSQFAAGDGNNAVATIEKGMHAVPSDHGLAAIYSHGDDLREAAAFDDERPVVLLVMNDPLDDTAIELLKTLVEANKTNDIERLASRLQQLTERHPDFLPAQLQLVQCLASMRRFEEALIVARHAASSFPSSPQPAAFAVQVSATAGRWQDMKDAAEMLKKRTVENPLLADLSIAQALIQLRQFDAALSQLQPYVKAASADPDRYPEVVRTRAIAQVHSDQTSAASEMLWPLTSRSAQWRMRWMQVALEISNGSEAVAWLDRLGPTIMPNAIGEKTALAQSYDLLGTRLNDPAIVRKSDEIFAGILSDPAVTATAVVAAGSRAEVHGDLTTAEKLYRRALKMEPGLWVAQNNLAITIVHRGGDPKEASEYVSAAVKLQPKQATLRDTLAQAQSEAGDAKAAADSELLAIQLDPDDPRWRVRRAKYLFDSGDVTSAKKVVHDLETQRLDMDRLSAAQKADVNRELDAVRKRAAGTKTL
jgi:predicted Zn-dependent protease